MLTVPLLLGKASVWSPFPHKRYKLKVKMEVELLRTF